MSPTGTSLGGELRPDLYLGYDFYLSHLGDTKTACHQIVPDPILWLTELCFPPVFLVDMVSERLLQTYHDNCLGHWLKEILRDNATLCGRRGHLLCIANLNLIGTG